MEKRKKEGRGGVSLLLLMASIRASSPVCLSCCRWTEGRSAAPFWLNAAWETLRPRERRAVMHCEALSEPLPSA